MPPNEQPPKLTGRTAVVAVLVFVIGMILAITLLIR